MDRHWWAHRRPPLLVFAIVVLGVLATGCAQGAQPGPPPAAAPAAGSGPVTPKVNRVVLALNLQTEGNDPRYASQAGLLGIRPMHEFLVGTDAATAKLVPEIGAEWSLEEGPAYRFKLRKGVQFHKGFGEMTAKDVVFSYENRIMPDATSQTAIATRQIVRDVQVVNDYEILVRLKQADPRFLGTVGGGWEVLSKASSEKAGGKAPTIAEEPIAGTGPYQFAARTQGSFIRYQRVAFQHWRITPDFPEFEYRIIKEDATRLAALLAREVQLATVSNDLQPSAIRAGMKVVASPAGRDRIFATFFCCYLKEDGKYAHESPLLDPRLRRALNKAIDRDALNKAFFAGKGEPMLHNLLYPTDPSWNPRWKEQFADRYGYDPAAAKRLLAEAGYDATKPLKMYGLYSDRFAGSDNVTDAILGFWRSVGVDTEGQTLDGNTQRAMIRNLQFINSLYVLNSALDTFTSMASYFSPYTARLGFDHPAAVAVFDEVQKTLDEAKVKALLTKWGDVVYDEYLDIPMLLIPIEVTINPEIVASYTFPGTLIGAYSHPEYIKAAR